jgi:hypothetical protein
MKDHRIVFRGKTRCAALLTGCALSLVNSSGGFAQQSAAIHPVARPFIPNQLRLRSSSRVLMTVPWHSDPNQPARRWSRQLRTQPQSLAVLSLTDFLPAVPTRTAAVCSYQLCCRGGRRDPSVCICDLHCGGKMLTGGLRACLALLSTTVPTDKQLIPCPLLLPSRSPRLPQRR